MYAAKLNAKKLDTGLGARTSYGRFFRSTFGIRTWPIEQPRKWTSCHKSCDRFVVSRLFNQLFQTISRYSQDTCCILNRRGRQESGRFGLINRRPLQLKSARKYLSFTLNSFTYLQIASFIVINDQLTNKI